MNFKALGAVRQELRDCSRSLVEKPDHEPAVRKPKAFPGTKTS